MTASDLESEFSKLEKELQQELDMAMKSQNKSKYKNNNNKNNNNENNNKNKNMNKNKSTKGRKRKLNLKKQRYVECNLSKHLFVDAVYYPSRDLISTNNNGKIKTVQHCKCANSNNNTNNVGCPNKVSRLYYPHLDFKQEENNPNVVNLAECCLHPDSGRDDISNSKSIIVDNECGTLDGCCIDIMNNCNILHSYKIDIDKIYDEFTHQNMYVRGEYFRACICFSDKQRIDSMFVQSKNSFDVSFNTVVVPLQRGDVKSIGIKPIAAMEQSNDINKDNDDDDDDDNDNDKGLVGRNERIIHGDNIITEMKNNDRDQNNDERAVSGYNYFCIKDNKLYKLGFNRMQLYVWFLNKQLGNKYKELNNTVRFEWNLDEFKSKKKTFDFERSVENAKGRGKRKRGRKFKKSQYSQYACLVDEGNMSPPPY